MTENQAVTVRAEAKRAFEIVARSMNMPYAAYENLQQAQHAAFEELAAHFLKDPICPDCGEDLVCSTCFPFIECPDCGEDMICPACEAENEALTPKEETKK